MPVSHSHQLLCVSRSPLTTTVTRLGFTGSVTSQTSCAELPKLRAYQGKVASSASVLADALEAMSRLEKELSRLAVYASMLADQDTRVAEHQGMQQEMQQIFANFAAQVSYLEPELLKAGAQTVERFWAPSHV